VIRSTAVVFHERHNRFPEKSPRDFSLENLESPNEVLDLDAQFAGHFLQMASAIIPRALNPLLETVKNLGEIPMLANLCKEKAGEINRFYNRLRVQFDYTSDIVSEMREDVTKLRILALREQIKGMAPQIALLATWAEELGSALVAGLERSSDPDVEARGEGYGEDQEASDEEQSSVGELSTIAHGVRKRLLNIAADIRAQMAMLSSGSEEHSVSTVADLVAAFSNPVVFVDASPSSEVVSTDPEPSQVM
jgi:hypothetical protein